MKKPKNQFSRKEWDKCCATLCEDCLIANTYILFYRSKKKAKKKIVKHKSKICGES